MASKPSRRRRIARRSLRRQRRNGQVATAKSSRAAVKPARRDEQRRKAAANDDPPAGEVRFTHPDRVYWADVGITKQDLADYYRAVWDWMAPYVVNRPLSLVRCPDGTAGECFFQKHASAGLSEAHLRTVIDSKRRQIIADRRPRRPALAGAGRRARSPCARLDDRQPRSVRPHRVRSRSGRRRRLVGHRRGRARRARSARRHRSRRASSSSRAARGCTSWCRSRARTGRR